MGTTTIPVSEITKPKADISITETPQPVAVTPVPNVNPAPRLKVDRNSRAVDQATIKMKAYLEAPIGSATKTQALKELTQIICTHPKKPILDMVYKAYVENRNSEALNPMNALQGLQRLSPSDNWKARMLYQVMMKLSSGDKDLRLSTDTIHNVLGEEIATWVSVKLENLKRRRH